MKPLSLLLILWLLIGAAAAYQRDYFRGGDATCAKTTTIVITILAGPLNYLGVNPRAKCPNVSVKVPQPSK